MGKKVLAEGGGQGFLVGSVPVSGICRRISTMVGKDSSPLPPTTNMEDIRARTSKDSTGAVDRGGHDDRAIGGSHGKLAARGRRPLPTFRGLPHRVAKSLHRFYIEKEKGQRPVLREAIRL